MTTRTSPSPLEFPTPGWWAHVETPDRAWYFDGKSWSPWVSDGDRTWLEPPPATLVQAPHTSLVRCVLAPGQWFRGDLVRHHSFGFGEVIDVRGSDHTAEAVVRFFEVGIKHLSLHWAKLEKVL